MKATFGIGYFVLGVIQFFAIWDGIEVWTGMDGMLVSVVFWYPISIFVATLPIVGQFVGMFGAVHAWNWTWIQSGALFFGVPAFVILLAFGESLWNWACERLGQRMR